MHPDSTLGRIVALDARRHRFRLPEQPGPAPQGAFAMDRFQAEFDSRYRRSQLLREAERYRALSQIRRAPVAVPFVLRARRIVGRSLVNAGQRLQGQRRVAAPSTTPSAGTLRLAR